MGDHTRGSWPLDFDPRIAAPSDEARSAAVGRGGDRRVMSECENERRRMWAESSRSVPPSGASSTSCRWWSYAEALYKDKRATLDDLREAVTTLVETERTARRVLGGAHPLTKSIELALRKARAALRARETPSGSA